MGFGARVVGQSSSFTRVCIGVPEEELTPCRVLDRLLAGADCA
jgi:hypothetical protein